jgi:HEAT repeat protein
MFGHKRLLEWLANLADPDPQVRVAAMYEFREFEQPAPAAVAAIIRLLQHDADRHVRSLAAETLALETRARPETIAALLAAFKDADADVRMSAVTSVELLAPKSEEAVRALIDAASDPSLRNKAICTLGVTGPAGAAAVPFLVECLGNPGTTAEAAEALCGLAAAGEPATETAVEPLIGLLQSNDVDTRRHAAEALGHVGQAAQAAVPALVDAFYDREFYESALEAAKELMPGGPEGFPPCPWHPAFVQLAIARSLLRLGADRLGINATIKLLRSPAGFVRYQAIRIFKGLGPSARGVLPIVMRLLADRDPHVRSVAAYASAAIGIGSRRVVRALIQGLDDHDGEVRARFAGALGTLGPGAAQAIERLEREAARGGPRTRLAAAQALWKICQWPGTVEAAVAALRSHDFSLRCEAAHLLGDMQQSAKTAVAALQTALRDDECDVRHSAAQALLEIEAETGKWN